MIWIELCILLACILVGARLGGIALGTVAGLGLALFVFVFAMPPGGPPGAVLGMIIAVITALAAMQAAGGLDYLVAVAEKVMRRHAQYITIVAPVVTYLLVFASGTTHVIYALLPVIAEVSRKAGIRPERPMSISVIAGFQGVIASPISAATVAMIGLLVQKNISLPRMLLVVIPSTLIAVILGALSVAWRGKELNDDPEYRKRCASGQLAVAQQTAKMPQAEIARARGSTILFLAGIAVVVLIGMFPQIRPMYQTVTNGEVDTDQIGMGFAIMIVMLAIAALTTIFFKASPDKMLKGTIMNSGVSAVISILGVAWLGSSFFEGNRNTIVSGISQLVESHAWAFGAGLFILSSMLFSAAATVAILIPVGLAIGLQPYLLVAFYPAANSVFLFPTYGTLLAAVSFDQTGTTKIGKFLFNHSFLLPGLVTVVSAVVLAVLLGSVFLQ
ncbi:MAG TPA: anaerobic C4-dicarboxylate transporter family protein [Dongiaceae bacterium]|nr:anaerobic C4-dicarboxylate transporter family protein [Dongiaceae bacterium]